jgi:hypothetical protein
MNAKKGVTWALTGVFGLWAGMLSVSLGCIAMLRQEFAFRRGLVDGSGDNRA